MTEFSDTIEREMTFSADIERVWRAITDPAEVRQWFGDRSEYELREGGAGVYQWGDNAHRMQVVTVDPPHRFVIRWVISQHDDLTTPFEQMHTTQVEYLLDSVPEGTRLRLTESGFASLPADVREGYHADNSGGWTSELGKLVTYLEAPVTAR